MKVKKTLLRMLILTVVLVILCIIRDQDVLQTNEGYSELEHAIFTDADLTKKAPDCRENASNDKEEYPVSESVEKNVIEDASKKSTADTSEGTNIVSDNSQNQEHQAEKRTEIVDESSNDEEVIAITVSGAEQKDVAIEILNKNDLAISITTYDDIPEEGMVGEADMIPLYSGEKQ